MCHPSERLISSQKTSEKSKSARQAGYQSYETHLGQGRLMGVCDRGSFSSFDIIISTPSSYAKHREQLLERAV